MRLSYKLYVVMIPVIICLIGIKQAYPAYVSGVSEPSGTLVSFEGTEEKDVRDDIPGHVYVSRENSDLQAGIVFRPESDPVNGVLVSWEPARPGKLVVRTNRLKPYEIDLKFVKIFKDEHIDSVEEYSRWLADKISYKKDDAKDTWSSPAETLEKASGDCEDLAFLNAAALKVLGYNPKVFALIDGIVVPSHAVCVFETSEGYGMLDNMKLIRTTYQNLDDIWSKIKEKTTFSRIYEITEETPQSSLDVTLSGNN